MNKSYNLIWSHAKKAWIAASEVTRMRGKKRSKKRSAKVVHNPSRQPWISLGNARFKSISVPVMILSTGLLAPCAYAQTVTAVTSGQWDQAATWSNSAAPSVNNNYVVGSGIVLSSPSSGGNVSSWSFGGGSLTIQSGGALQLVSDSTSTSATPSYSIAGLTLNSGATLSLIQTSTGSGNVNRTLTTGLTLAPSGNVTLNTSSVANSYNNGLILASTSVLSGGAEFDLNFNVTGQSGLKRKFLEVDSANNPYTGNWVVTSTNITAGTTLGGLYAGAINALGTGTVTLNSSLLDNMVNDGLDSISG